MARQDHIFPKNGSRIFLQKGIDTISENQTDGQITHECEGLTSQHIIGLSPQSQTPPGRFEGAGAIAPAAGAGIHPRASLRRSMRAAPGPTLCARCRSVAWFSRAWSGGISIEVTTNPAKKALDRTGLTGIVKVVILAVPFDRVSPRKGAGLDPPLS
jgi:hypothetical protein